MPINFTPEHESNLRILFLELGFTGEVLTGKFGANAYTVWDCIHNLQVSTLKQINSSLKKEIAALEDVDEWSTSNKQQYKANKLRKWQAFVSLCIGYKLKKEETVKAAKEMHDVAVERITMLKQIKNQAEIDELKKLSAEDLQKMIDEERSKAERIFE